MVRPAQPSSRHVRALLAGETVVDSREQLLVWEPELPVPRYLFRAEDVGARFLKETSPPAKLGYHHPNGEVSRWFDVVVGDRTLRQAAWVRSEFPGHVGVTWEHGEFDHWFEEAQEVVEHPHDPFVHLDAYSSDRRVTVTSGGVVLAESTDAVFLWETGLPARYYLPRADVHFETLTPTETESTCPYKGFATDYWSSETVRDVAWSYPEPFFPYRNIADRIAFLNERVDIAIDGVEQPRPVSKKWAARARLA